LTRRNSITLINNMILMMTNLKHNLNLTTNLFSISYLGMSHGYAEKITAATPKSRTASRQLRLSRLPKNSYSIRKTKTNRFRSVFSSQMPARKDDIRFTRRKVLVRYFQMIRPWSTFPKGFYDSETNLSKITRRFNWTAINPFTFL
jgi:hypothetical protein